MRVLACMRAHALASMQAPTEMSACTATHTSDACAQARLITHMLHTLGYITLGYLPGAH